MANFPAPLQATLQAPWEALRNWPTTSQQRARRNAMVACTALARHTAEIRETEEFLARHGGLVPEPRRHARG